MSEQRILDAIYDDDRSEVKRLLKTNSALATLVVEKAKLYEGKILHWIYVGDTPLHLAAAGYRVEIVRLLLAAGADPNSAENHRRSGPLHYAADSWMARAGCRVDNQVETIRCLLDAGAKINAPDKNGATPLHRAVRTRGAAAVKCLLEAGADASLKNKPGSAAFHLAVQNTGHGGTGSEASKIRQREIIQEFLSRGVSVEQKDGKGKSVLACAQREWIREVIAWLTWQGLTWLCFGWFVDRRKSLCASNGTIGLGRPGSSLQRRYQVSVLWQ